MQKLANVVAAQTLRKIASNLNARADYLSGIQKQAFLGRGLRTINNAINGGVSQIGSAAAGAAKGAYNTVADYTKQSYANMGNAASALGNTVKNVGGAYAGGVREASGNVANRAAAAGQRVYNAAGKVAQKAYGNIQKNYNDVIKPLATGYINAAKAYGRGVADTATGYYNGHINNLKQTGERALLGVARHGHQMENAYNQAAAGVRQGMNEIGQDARDFGNRASYFGQSVAKAGRQFGNDVRNAYDESSRPDEQPYADGQQ